MVHLISLENGLTSNQAIQLLELYDLMGLDPTKPLVVSATQRYVGDASEINQSINVTLIETTVTRNP